MSQAKPLVVSLVAFVVLTCAVAGSAQAATVRYASPSGASKACSQILPCSLQSAVGASVPGDTVVAFGDAGTYGSPGTPIEVDIVLPPKVTLEGFPGQPLPILYSKPSSSGAVRTEEGAHIERFEIHSLNPAAAVYFGASTASVSRVIADAPEGTGCQGISGAIVDSVCSGEYGFFDSAGGGIEFSLTLRNDTIIGTTHEAAVFEGENNQMKATIVNSILQGHGTDLRATKIGTGSVTVGLEHSNYAYVMNVGGSVTPAGSGSNQSVAPQFVDLAGGDLREASGSPTIDAGVNDPANGSTDLDGNARALLGPQSCAGAAAVTDIGAYEFVPGPLGPCPSTQQPPPSGPPNTSITKARIGHDKAKFTFQGSGGAGPLHFECKLDRKPFRPCGSPKAYKHLQPGRHRFQVRAVDAAGTPDRSPVARAFHISKPS